VKRTLPEKDIDTQVEGDVNEVDEEDLEEEIMPEVIVLACIEEHLGWIGELERLAPERETFAADAEARSFSLPPGDVTDKLLRNEAHLDKQLYRATDQLERLQRRRKGEAVPPPLNINLGRGR
jgi:hypothetical protein